MDDRQRELEGRLLDAVGGAEVLTKGRLYEHKRLRDEIRILWVEWGRKWEPRSRVITYLAFSSRDAHAAETIRAELDRRHISKGPAIELPSPSRAERTRESHSILTPKSK